MEILVITSGGETVVLRDGSRIGCGPTRESALVNAREQLVRELADVDELLEEED